MAAMVSVELTVQDSDVLRECEAEIETGYKTFIKVGQALLRIRDERLYRENYPTFESYCQGRWQLGRRQAYRLIEAVQVVENVTHGSQMPAPTSERHVRPLTRLEPEQQRQAWAAVVAETPREQITEAKVQEAVERIAPRRGNGHRPEFRAFEREELLPRLRDAGIPDAPQILTGRQEDPQSVPREERHRAGARLREAVIEELGAILEGAETDLDVCADRILETLGHGYSSIAVAARFGAALACGPKTLADLTELCASTCGKCIAEMDRDEYTRWRKRAARTIDALTFANGLGIFQHALANGQIVFALNQE